MTRLDDPTELTSLAEARRRLRESVQPHRESINFFASERGFFRIAAEVAHDEDAGAVPEILEPRDDKISGVTTALTCFESLSDAVVDFSVGDPRQFSGLQAIDQTRLNAFAKYASSRTDSWKSEGAARRYCIVRAIAPMARLATKDQYSLEPLKAAVIEVWDRVHPDPDSCGLYEVSQPRRATRAVATSGIGESADAAGQRVTDEKERGIPADSPPTENTKEQWYPPNAFLTYWGIRSLQAVSVDASLMDQLGIATIWLRSVIGQEVALYHDGEHDRDPQQLAWAICGVLASQNKPLADRPGNESALIKAGLKCFFEQQLPSGSWETGRALFHYPEAGNAYCYIFETLAELVSLSLENSAYAIEFRQMLVPYIPQLLRASDYLESTKRALGEPGQGRFGWSSGHHPHRTSPESWATATAYRYLQALRRVVGWQARELAVKALQARSVGKSELPPPERGLTWDAGSGSAGDLLAALFVNPRRARPIDANAIDPDRPMFDESWARSALLFGPPGTGKTNLAKSVAGELGWAFIEISPADFLDQGTEMVSARADEIFRMLLEIDGAVVLLDEIDELVRARTKDADMLGRFFTTTMLPRLARLWSARKLIFFVNTNSIGRVDPAISRSQRFDAAIFVLPPSFEQKIARLSDETKSLLSKEEIDKVLDKYPDRDISSGDAGIAWFAFLRYDQLGQLDGRRFEDKKELLAALTRLGEDVFPDWSLAGDGADNGLPEDADGRLKWMLDKYRTERRHQRIDPRRERYIRVPVDRELPEWLAACGLTGFALWNDGSAPRDEHLNGAGELREV